MIDIAALNKKIKNKLSHVERVFSVFAPMLNFLTSRKRLSNLFRLLGAAIKVAVTFSFYAILVVACNPKNREAQLPLNDQKDLLLIADYDQKEFDLETRNLLDSPLAQKEVSTANAHNIDKGFGYVNYETKSDLMTDVPVIGQANKKYKIKYVIDGKWLRVYKISDLKDLSTSEQTYSTPANIVEGKLKIVSPSATKSANNNKERQHLKQDFNKLTPENNLLMKTPLVAYIITGFYKVGVEKDQNGDATTRLQLISESSKEQATHFKLDLLSKEIFKDLQKSEYFPKSYFNGEWYYGSTIESSSFRYTDIESLTHHPLASAKIKFAITRQELIALDLNVPFSVLQSALKSGSEKELQDLPTVLVIPSQLNSFKEFFSNNATSFQEEVNKETGSQNADYIHLSLRNTMTPFFNSDRYDLSDIIVENDYFQFTLLDKESSYKIIHSFYRTDSYRNNPNNVTNSNKPYQKITLTKEMSKKMGFLSIFENTVKDVFETENSIDKKRLVVRFNPERKKIVYHFSKNTPEWIKPLARKAVESWNTAFKFNGLQTQIELDETKIVDEGDVRYNILNLYEDIENKNDYAGMAYSLVDTTSGEVISAWTNVNIRSTLDGFKRQLVKYYLRNDKDIYYDGFLNENETLKPSQLKINTDLQKLSTVESVQNIFANNFKLYSAKSVPGTSTNVNVAQTDEKNISKLQPRFQKYISSLDNSLWTHESMHDRTKKINPQLKEKIESIGECQVIDSEISKISEASSVLSWMKQNTLAVDLCARQIAQNVLMHTLLHEMGHNFGLHHNFAASADAKNYPMDKNAMRSSSVMDYISTDDVLKNIELGPYDLAISKYIYTGKLDDHSFLFCSKDDLKYRTNLLCDAFDSGSTPIEILENTINNYNNEFQEGHVRHFSAERFPFHPVVRRFQYLLKIKSFYEQWRMQVARFLNKDDIYLEKFDDKQFQLWLHETYKNNSEFKKVYDYYYLAAEKSFLFLKQIAFAPDHYCVAKDRSDAVITIVPFANIYSSFDTNNNLPINCKESKVVDILKKKYPNLAKVDEFGYNLNDYYRKTYADRFAYSPDVWGIAYDRYAAMYLLTNRSVQNWNLRDSKIFPNYIDDPRFKKVIEQSLMDRIVKGVKDKSGNYYQYYSNERSILTDFYSEFFEALKVPEKHESNNMRMVRFRLLEPNKSSNLESSDAFGFGININGVNYTPAQDSEVSKSILSSYNNLIYLRATADDKKQIIEELQKFKERLKTFNNLQEMTVEKLISTHFDLMRITKVKTYFFLKYLEFFFGSQKDIYIEYFNTMSADYLNVTEYNSTNFYEFLKRYPNLKGKTLNMDKVLQELEVNFSKALIQIDKDAQKFNENRTELQAQIDLLYAIATVNIH